MLQLSELDASRLVQEMLEKKAQAEQEEAAAEAERARVESLQRAVELADAQADAGPVGRDGPSTDNSPSDSTGNSPDLPSTSTPSSGPSSGQAHEYECGSCGYTLFPAPGREDKFFGPGFKCPQCGAPKSEFIDRGEV